MIQAKIEPSATEICALLIITRLAHFFCGTVPYSSTLAAQSALTAAVQLLLICPFLLRKSEYHVWNLASYATRGFALLLAAKSAADTYRFLVHADAPHPAWTIALLIITVGYILSLPRCSESRAAIFLLSASILAFILLPLGGRASAKALSLWSQIPLPPFWQEWADSAEAALLPLIIESAQERGKRAVWISFAARILFFPLLILYGAMQCGRLRINGSAPFLMLLQRVPFSDTLRTDGMWWMLAVGCSLLTITFLLRFCFIHAKHSAQMRCTGVAALTAFTILFILYPPSGLAIAAISVFLCIAAWMPRKERAV